MAPTTPIVPNQYDGASLGGDIEARRQAGEVLRDGQILWDEGAGGAVGRGLVLEIEEGSLVGLNVLFHVVPLDEPPEWGIT